MNPVLVGDRAAARPVPLSLDSSLILYLLDDESVLFSRRSLQLYGLDRPATVVLLMLKDGMTREEIACRLGLNGESEQAVKSLAALLEGKESSAGYYENILPCPRKAPACSPDLARYRLLDTDFVLDGPGELLHTWVLPWLRHLASEHAGEPDLVIAVEQQGAGCRFFMNGVLQHGILPANQLLPLLQDGLRRYAYQKRSCLLAVHGAVVARDGMAIALCGQSGSGKSTLAAALLARGYRLVSDEPALIDPEKGTALPVPIGLGLKQGSWPAAAADHPDLTRLPVHVRWDGQPVRYLMPDMIRMASSDPPLLTRLIFTRHTPNAAATIGELTPMQILREIVQSGYHLTGLDEERVMQLLTWITRVAGFSLVYGSTGEALALLRGSSGSDHRTIEIPDEPR